ncbi:MAG TPA: sigma 54-interacting transcriptional regulator [Myxococcaceae bacterium]|nr:sigma 54-interacting transcriptional regulator [Myxococcaceae bacterium]
MDVSSFPEQLRVTRTTVPFREEGAPSRAYLLKLEGDTSAVFPLPKDGVILIGRSEEADLAVADPEVSRRHARLVIADGNVSLVDLDSHNGTRVNGAHLEDGSCALQSGDALTIGTATLVLHAARVAPAVAPLLGPEALRQRIEEELDRARQSVRALAIAVLTAPERQTRWDLCLGRLRAQLRLSDAVGRMGSELIVVMPERGPADAAAELTGWLEDLSDEIPSATAALASWPDDGDDGASLLALARKAAASQLHGSGGIGRAEQALSRFELGGRSILLAEPAMLAIYELLRRLAASQLPVLITGETGVGKEHAAFAVHHWSRRADGPFITVNCAALPESLLESELFGHERGAFTGATHTRIGLFEAADGGTVFLDEVGELSLTAQARLLRILEVKKLCRVGSTVEREVDLRVVGATHRRLEEEVRAGRFREDLFYRLSGATVALLPLRDRRRELPFLARDFLDDARRRAQLSPLSISAEAMQALHAHEWPGNIRELRNAMEYAAAVAGPLGPLKCAHLPAGLFQATTAGTTVTGFESNDPDGSVDAAPTFRSLAEELRELERRRMTEALAATGGVQTRAAALIGMPLRTFVLKVKQYQLNPARPGRVRPG